MAEALDAYDHALEYRDDSASLLRKKAVVLRGLGREEEALAAERQADALERDATM